MQGRGKVSQFILSQSLVGGRSWKPSGVFAIAKVYFDIKPCRNVEIFYLKKSSNFFPFLTFEV